RVGVVCSRMHLFVVFRRMLETSHSSGGGETYIGQGPSRAHEPALGPVGAGHDMRHAVAHPGGRAADPEVRRFGHVGICVDDRVTAHDIPLSILKGPNIVGALSQAWRI